jgi:hypothetical protein
VESTSVKNNSYGWKILGNILTIVFWAFVIREYEGWIEWAGFIAIAVNLMNIGIYLARSADER